jgi:Cupin domain
VHEREDELFYILEGDMDAYVGKKAFQVGAGQCLFLPKLKPHAFVFRSPRMRILVLLQPAGFENYFRTMGSPAEKLELPAGAMTYATSSLEHAIRVGEHHGVRFLSPEEVAKQLPLYYAALKQTARR